MDPIIQRPEQQQYQSPVSEQKHFLNKKFILTVVILLLLGVGAYTGIWFWNNMNKEAVVITYTPTIPTIPTADNTAGWKTYTNAKNTFSIKVPPGFVVGGNSDPSILTLERVNIIGTTTQDTWNIKIGNWLPLTACSTHEACFQILNSTVLGAKSAGSTQKFAQITVNANVVSLKGFEIWDEYRAEGGSIFPASIRYQIPMNYDGNYFEFKFSIDSATSVTPDVRAEGLVFVNQILSTFKFIEPIDSSDWRQYTDKKRGVEFEVPNNEIVVNKRFFEGLKVIEEYGGASFAFFEYWVTPHAPPDADNPIEPFESGEKIIAGRKFMIVDYKGAIYQYVFHSSSTSLYYYFTTFDREKLPIIERILSTLKFTK